MSADGLVSFSGGAPGVDRCRGAAPPAWSAVCWGRNSACSLKEGLRGPARERDGVVPRETGDVDEPNDRLDSDGGADAEHELAEPFVGEVITAAVERLADP